MLNETITHDGEKFENIDFSEKILRNREFYKCEFVRCNFMKSDLRGNSFEDCNFKDCNFSMTDIDGLGLRNVKFSGSKLLGIDFTRCNEFIFSFEFDNCYWITVLFLE